MVVLTRKQLEKLTKKELIDELLTVNSIHEDLANLTSRFKKLHETSLQKNRNIAKKRYGLFVIPYERNDRDKSGT